MNQPESIETIVCPTALGERWEDVLRFALDLAELYGAAIYVVHAVEPLPPSTRGLVDHIWAKGTVDKIRREGITQIHEQIESRIRRYCKAHGGAEAAARVASVIVDEEFPARLILRVVQDTGADMVVMGTHTHSVVGEVLGSVAHKVLHKCPVPVLLVPLREETT